MSTLRLVLDPEPVKLNGGELEEPDAQEVALEHNLQPVIGQALLVLMYLLVWATDQIPAKEKERAVPDVELYSMLNTALDASDNVRVSASQVTDTLIVISFALLTPP